MKRTSIAIIGHMPADKNFLGMSGDSTTDSPLVQSYNYTRVVTPDLYLADHVAYLKRELEIPKKDTFSVWEMSMCAVLLLATHLRNHGFDVVTANYIDSDNAVDTFDRLKVFDPDIVVLATTFILTRNHMATFAKSVRDELPDSWIVAGGHHIHTTLIYMDEEKQKRYLSQTKVDGFVNDSQGEAALLSICKEFPNIKKLKAVPNLVWRDPMGDIHVNQRIPETNDINSTVINLSSIEEGSVIHIRTARSCSFKCAFCSYPTIAGSLALMDLDNVIAMLHQAQDVGVKAMFFVDDTFNYPDDRFEQLINRMLDENIHITWYSFLRCQYVNERLVEKLAKTGCAGVFLGVESGSDLILKNMKKGAVTRFYRDGIRWLKQNGISTLGSFIVGFPGETTETVSLTKSFIEESELDYYFIQPFYYLHHTPVHKKAGRFGLKGSGLMWTHDTMNWHQALGHLSDLFLEIENSTFVNPDYTLWEVAYLRSKGMVDEEILAYRKKINRMTANQMKNYAVSNADSTSRKFSTADIQ
jgi:p-methyltransferase